VGNTESTLVRMRQLGGRAAGRPRAAGGADAVEPWFHRRPGLAVAVALGLYAGVLGLRWLLDAPEPIMLLFCFPVALLAVAFGVRAGLLAGLVGVVLIAVGTAVGGVELSFWDWVTRAAPMLLLGGLLGHAADQLSRSEAERNRLMAAAQRHRDAVDFNDRVLQELAAAKWALEAGSPERGLAIVTNTLDEAQDMVSRMLRDADAEAGG
jgi:Flp pilus assembly pilin Flp